MLIKNINFLLISFFSRIHFLYWVILHQCRVHWSKFEVKSPTMHAEILTLLNFYEVTAEKGSAIVKIVIKYIQQTALGKMWGIRFCLGYQISEIEKNSTRTRNGILLP